MPDQQWSLPLMISFFDGGPGDPEQHAQTKPMQLECEPSAHSSTPSTVSPGQLTPQRPCAIRQMEILKPANIVHPTLDTAEHVNGVTVTWTFRRAQHYAER